MPLVVFVWWQAMTDTLSDAAARLRAIEPQRSILLQAPAGSGKTTVLISRLMRLLGEVDAPEHILAITFTRKAAAEMHRRLVQALQADDGVAAKVRERSQRLGWNLLEQSSRLNIQTIDAFCFKLASQLPLAAKASGKLQLLDRPNKSYQRVVRRVLNSEYTGYGAADLAPQRELLFLHLDNNWSRIEDLLVDMLARRAHWLPYTLPGNSQALIDRVSKSVADIVGDQLQEACRFFSAADRQVAQSCLSAGVLSEEPSSLTAWQDIVASITVTGKKGDLNWRKQGFPKDKDKSLFKDCIDIWSLKPDALEFLKKIQILPAIALSLADSEILSALSSVLRATVQELQLEFTTTGQVDFTYISGAAREVLVSDGQITDLALSIGLNLRHILIDEFQDTSLAQFDLLQALTAAWDGNDGRSLFLVGDPMQSIYQFREAEVGLFLRARDFGIGAIKFEFLRLTRNFRSLPALIGWNNTYLARLFPNVDDMRSSAIKFAASEAGKITDTAASIDIEVFVSEKDEAFAVANKIKYIRALQPQASIAVLMRSRTRVGDILEALQSTAVPVLGIKLQKLTDCPVVVDLLALWRALTHLVDRGAWLAVLRAPWCGVNLHTLTHLINTDSKALLWHLLHDETALQGCEAAEVARLTRIRSTLQQALAAYPRLALARWLESTWLQLGAADCYPREQLHHAHRFFQLLHEQFANRSWREPLRLVELLEDFYTATESTDPNPVQIMTIHEAKGLEFDYVFLPASGKKLPPDKESLLHWQDLPRSHDQSDLLMAPVRSAADQEHSPLVNYVKALTKQRREHEDVRLLYVATTRAKQGLYLSAVDEAEQGKPPKWGRRSFFSKLWSVCEAQCKVNEAMSHPENNDSADATTAEPISMRRLPLDWRFPDISATSLGKQVLFTRHTTQDEVIFNWSSPTLRHIGTVVHRALQRLAATALPAAEKVSTETTLWRRQLRELGVQTHEIEGAVAEVKRAVALTLGDSRGRWILDHRHRAACSELALTGVINGGLINAVIDRSFIDEHDVRWIIDFKTSRHQGGDLQEFLAREQLRYQPQLQSYRTLVANLGPQSVRTALYFPLLGVFHEVL
jgi:ATP-dependent helicase/nuclease subunit A